LHSFAALRKEARIRLRLPLLRRRFRLIPSTMKHAVTLDDHARLRERFFKAERALRAVA